MDKEVKREALRQYLKYFRFWFIAVGVLLILTLGAAVLKAAVYALPRGNSRAPSERVYDYADVLTDDEEEELRAYIAKYEKKCHADLVVVTLNQPMGDTDYEWYMAMMNYADDFYDNGLYGWDSVYGDGALLLDNWYEDANGSQKGSWLSTSGKMERIIGSYEEDDVLDRMDVYIDSNPCEAYKAAVRRLAVYGRNGKNAGVISSTGILTSLIVPFIAALFFAITHLVQKKAEDTTTATTYVENGKPVLKAKSDEFIRKRLVSHRIESSGGGGHGGGGSHSHGGSYGSHTSSGGQSHGGGGRRR